MTFEAFGILIQTRGLESTRPKSSFSPLSPQKRTGPLRFLPGEADPQGIPMTLRSSLPKRIATQNHPPKPSQ